MQTVVGWIARPLGYLLGWIYSLVGSYGLAIVIFTIIVKVCLYPLYAKQMKSTVGMSKLQPRIKALQSKYANDKETMNAKMAELYREEGINPAGGCLPMLIQLPIIFGLFALLRNPLLYMGNSERMIFAIHESFLWMTDLSQPDKWILPILAGIATFLAFSLQQQQQQDMPGGSGGMMKAMKYVFPIMIVLMGRTFPAGLTIYWALSQVIQIFYNLRMNKVRRKLMEGDGKKGGSKRI
jgi:YidC/Oxa1 family membrane protein insertase